MRAFFNPKTQRMQKWDSNKNLKPWRQQLADCAMKACADSGGEIISKPTAVRVIVCFFLAKPASVPKNRLLPTVKPDADKLLRAVKDALKGTIYEDDSQVTDVVVGKRYGIPERAEIQVEAVVVPEFRPQIAKDLPLFAGVGA